MKFSAFLLLLIVYSCCPTNDQARNERKSSPQLANRYWTAEFYHYRNVYHFQPGNKGVCYIHQRAFSIPVDPEIWKREHIAEDSMVLQEEQAFTFKFKNSLLTITFLPDENGERLPEEIFTLSDSEDGELRFCSKHEYAYGREVLIPEPKTFKYRK